ncbi:MAG: hypothetical protein KDA55_17190 [Planctomycetales bacterium]|nr:hypothetical protein [Planctomycetales bacterium]
MARRIVVIISQSPNSDPARRDFEEELATRLLFERGIDVSLVPHLEHLEPGSTGLLCLEGVKGDMVLLNWSPEPEAFAALKSRGIAGRPGRHRLVPTHNPAATVDSAASGPQAQRFIFCLNLAEADSADAVLDEINRIREEASVQTVSLALGGLAKPATERPSAPSAPVVPLAPNPQTAEPTSPEPRPSASPPSAGAPKSDNDDDDAMEARLDQLLDELDSADW